MPSNATERDGASGRTQRPARPRAGILPGGISARLMLLITLALVPALLLTGWGYYQRYQVRRQTAFQAELEVAQGVAATFGAFLNDIRRTSYAVGQAILTLEPYAPAQATRILSAAASQYPAMRGLSWLSPRGVVLASSAPALVGRDLSSRAYFRRVLAGRPWAVGDLTPTGVDVSVPTVGLAVAVRGQDGVLRGMVAAAIEPTRLADLTLTHKRPADGAYAVFDGRGVLVFRNPGPRLSWTDRVRWAESDAVLRRVLSTGRAEVGRTRLAVPGGEWIAARAPIGSTGWVAGAERPTRVAFAPVRRGLAVDSLLALGVVGLGLLMAGLVARTISAPIRRLERDSQAMGAGEPSSSADPQAPTEVRRLRDTVTRMAADIMRRAEAVRESERRLNTIVESLAEGLIVSDLEGNLVHWNRAAIEMHGFTSPDQAERHVHEFTDLFELSELGGEVVPYDRWPLPRVLRGEEVRDWELRIRRLHNADWTRVYSYGGTLVRDPAGQPMMAVLTIIDVTERRRAEDEIRRLNADLEQRVIERTAQLRQRATELETANKELEAFSYSVSHDLRTPLRSIDGFSKLLLEDYSGVVDATGQDYLNRVRAAAQRMGQLIDDILKLSRATRVEMQRRRVDLTAMAESVVSDLRASAPQRVAEVTIAPGMTAVGDENLLRIALENLLGNAWKFTRDRTPARISFDATVQDDEQVYCIRDNGAGFDMAYAGKLFGAFQRLHSDAEFAGTGIGLALVQRIIRRHGGRIWASGAVGQGATFCFTLGEDA